MSDQLAKDAEEAVLATLMVRNQQGMPLDYPEVLGDATNWLLVKTLGAMEAEEAKGAIEKALRVMAEDGRLERLPIGQAHKLSDSIE